MRCGKQSFWSAWVLLLLLLCMALVSTRAEDQSEPPMPQPSPQWSENSASTGTLQTDPWASFDLAWTNLKLELIGWSEDSQTLYDSLQVLKTEADGLRYSLTLSREQFEASEEARMIERKAAEARVVDAIMVGINATKERDKAVKAQATWRATALVLAGAAITGWLIAIF